MQSENRALITGFILVFVIAAAGAGLYHVGQAFGIIAHKTDTGVLAETDNRASQPIDQQDLDGDGLTAAYEKEAGTNPVKKDTDGDGYDDKTEIDSGHDPLVPANAKGTTNTTATTNSTNSTNTTATTSTNSTINTTNATGNTTPSSDFEIDTDGDGLSDGREKLYKTNPRKKDTDGDGYDDQEEILTGHDPLKK